MESALSIVKNGTLLGRYWGRYWDVIGTLLGRYCQSSCLTSKSLCCRPGSAINIRFTHRQSGRVSIDFFGDDGQPVRKKSLVKRPLEIHSDPPANCPPQPPPSKLMASRASKSILDCMRSGSMSPVYIIEGGGYRGEGELHEGLFM